MTTFHDGMDLFNAGKFFEAHEVWEELWRTASIEDRDYLQGLIQAAGHYVLLGKQNWSGAERLGEKALAKLGARSEDLKPLIQALQHNCAYLKEKQGLNCDPGHFRVAQLGHSG